MCFRLKYDRDKYRKTFPSFSFLSVVTCKAANTEKLGAGEEKNRRFPWVEESAHRLEKGIRERER